MASAEPRPEDLSPGRHAFVTIGVILGMLMQVLDITIANVALPHIQASLGATPETISWVLTSYILASAVAIPITGWLADRIGRKPLFVGAAIGFAGASALCAIAQNIGEMVFFRACQGVAGAFLVPLAQSTLLDINPPEKRGSAMALFGAGVMVGPILGPVLGGWLTQDYDWRWVFLINLPVGVLTALLTWRSMPSFPKMKRSFDLFGFALLGLSLAALQLMLDRGSQLDWFSSWEIRIEAGVAIAGAWMFLVHMLTRRDALFDRRMFRDRNFSAGLFFMAITGLMLFAGLSLLPPLLQNLLGYSSLQAGLLTAPRGVGTLVTMVIVGRLVGRIDARLLIGAGICLLALSLYQMSQFTLGMDSRPVIVSGVMQGLALGLIFVPLNTIAFATLDARYRTAGTSLFNLARSIGGSIGISIMSALLIRNIQISHADLAAFITPHALSEIGRSLAMNGRTAALAATVDGEINRQASMIAFIDDFRLMMMLALCTLPLVPLLRSPRRGATGQAGRPPQKNDLSVMRLLRPSHLPPAK